MIPAVERKDLLRWSLLFLAVAVLVAYAAFGR